MSVTARDALMFEGLAMFRVLHLTQIRRYFYAELSRPLMQRRLGRLRDQGWLRSFPFGEHGQLAWTLTSKAARFVGRSEKIFRRPPNLNTLAHDLMVSEVGLRLKRTGLLHDWISSYEIEARSFKYGKDQHIPDAVFRLRFKNVVMGPIGLEIEHSLKSRERIRSMLHEYRHRLKMTDLWIFWRKEWMGREFKKLTPDPHPPRIWIADESVGTELRLSLKSLTGELIDLEAPKLWAGDTGGDTEPGTVADKSESPKAEDKNAELLTENSGATPTPTVLNARDPSPSTLHVVPGGNERGVTA